MLTSYNVQTYFQTNELDLGSCSVWVEKNNRVPPITLLFVCDIPNFDPFLGIIKCVICQCAYSKNLVRELITPGYYF